LIRVDFRFDHNWKKIEEHVRTKTTVQVIPNSDSINTPHDYMYSTHACSHAQKYFLKVRNLGVAAGAAAPKSCSEVPQCLYDTNTGKSNTGTTFKIY
jgi:hypothetical protein